MDSASFWGETATIELIKLASAVITTVLAAYIALKSKKADTQNEEIHKAVNSTATAMAKQLADEQDKNSALSARVAALEERAAGKQVAQDLKDAEGA